jgi:ATP-dependent Clp protease ATP-binding subunit ClpA
MEEQEGKRSVVLLDEFDHCDPETWEAFYHIFDEGVFTQKKVAARQQGNMTRTSNRLLWIVDPFVIFSM